MRRFSYGKRLLRYYLPDQAYRGLTGKPNGEHPPAGGCSHNIVNITVGGTEMRHILYDARGALFTKRGLPGRERLGNAAANKADSQS